MANDHTDPDARGTTGPVGWTFEVVEISNGGWECRGVDGDGRQVSRQGSGPDRLLPERGRQPIGSTGSSATHVTFSDAD